MKRLAWAVAALLSLLVIGLGIRAADQRSGPPLGPWHRFVPPELDAHELDGAGWSDYLAAEQRAFDAVRDQVSEQLAADERAPSNRYFTGSPMHGSRLAQDWNRSFVLEPDGGSAAGAVVLLHGMTDAPYSLRHVARHYQRRGFTAWCIRLPGHGTVPGALTEVQWQDWLAATRLALREARRQIGDAKPLHVVGYSNGGALALKAALDAIEDASQPRPQQLVLISPMVGVTAMARFAGVLGWPAVLPPFAQAAWLNVVPEYNPFKYNSFPVNAARQSSLLTRALQGQLARLAADGRIKALPPVLTFQSVVDQTVSTPAVVSALYARLQANGSELVMFDINRRAQVSPLLRSSAATALERIVATPPQRYAMTLLTNAPGDDPERVVEQRTPAGAVAASVRELDDGLRYPRDLFSLSHIALPFPPHDGLYGARPVESDNFGVQLGTISARGETGVLLVGLDALTRVSWNPLFDYLLRRIDNAALGRTDAAP